MKEKWFEFVKANKVYWTHGMTLKRLERVKDAVFKDEDIMWDLMVRHHGNDFEPEILMLNDKHFFDHAIGNFVCNIHYKMMDLKIIKG